MLTLKESWKDYFSLRKINVVIRVLTISDVLIIGSFGLINPIFAIFITQTIQNGSVEVAGVASGVYLLTKSIFQIPFALFFDKIKGERDDFWAMFFGSMLYSLIPIAYLFISTPGQLYLVQFVYGIFSALIVPSWFAIFTRHIDKNYEGVEWGVYQTLTSFAGGGTALLGGVLASELGFAPLFISISFLSLVGSLFLLFIYKNMKKGRIFFRI
ncbi:MAG: MFS transporter [Patescibacteria group bacterium]